MGVEDLKKQAMSLRKPTYSGAPDTGAKIHQGKEKGEACFDFILVHSFKVKLTRAAQLSAYLLKVKELNFKSH